MLNRINGDAGSLLDGRERLQEEVAVREDIATDGLTTTSVGPELPEEGDAADMGEDDVGQQTGSCVGCGSRQEIPEPTVTRERDIELTFGPEGGMDCAIVGRFQEAGRQLMAGQWGGVWAQLTAGQVFLRRDGSVKGVQSPCKWPPLAPILLVVGWMLWRAGRR